MHECSCMLRSLLDDMHSYVHTVCTQHAASVCMYGANHHSALDGA